MRGSSAFPSACYGRHVVNRSMITPCCVRKRRRVVGGRLHAVAYAMPKSRTFTRAPLTTMLSGLMSDDDPFECASARASATARPIRHKLCFRQRSACDAADSGSPSHTPSNETSARRSPRTRDRGEVRMIVLRQRFALRGRMRAVASASAATCGGRILMATIGRVACLPLFHTCPCRRRRLRSISL